MKGQLYGLKMTIVNTVTLIFRKRIALQSDGVLHFMVNILAQSHIDKDYVVKDSMHAVTKY